MNLPTAQPSNETPALSLWQLCAAISLALVFGPLVTVQTATVGCQHHTIDACIPVLEPLLGLIVAAATFIWLATSPRRGRSVSSGLKLAIVGIVIWFVSNVALAPVICPDPGRNDVVCPYALPLGAASFVVIVAAAWRLQGREHTLVQHERSEDLV